MPTLTPDWYRAALQASGDVVQRDVIFVLGCQKSGTSWLVKLLDAHPHVCCRGEGHFADLLAPALLQAIRAVNEQSKRAWKCTDPQALAAIRLLCDQTFAAYLARCERPDDIRIVGDKTPESALAIPLLDALYPGARFLHIIRDGRDGAVSGWAHLHRSGEPVPFDSFASYAAYFARSHWQPYIVAARQAGADRPDRYLEVRYEDLHARPQEQAARLFEFLGTGGDEQTVRACVEAASFRRASGGRAPGEEDRAAHLRKGVVGDWREHFDEDAARAFEAAAGPLLAELGYASPAAFVREAA